MLKENISAAYIVLDIEIEEPHPIYDRDTQNKAEELGRLGAATKEKLITTSNTEILQRKGILAQPSQKKGKTMAQETTDLVHTFYEDDEYSRQLPGKKDYVSIQKVVHKQKRLVLCSIMNFLLHLKKETQM